MAWRGLLVSVLISALVVGCATWRHVPPDEIAKVIREAAPSRARVSSQGSTAEVSHPSVHNDSLVGTVGHDKAQRASFALDAIDSLTYRSTNRTAGWILAGGSVAFLTGLWVTGNGIHGIDKK
jgi:hypothetical protein